MARSIVCDLHKIFKSSVSAVFPENLVKRAVKYNPANQELTVAGEKYNLTNKNVYLVGTGKAVQYMAKEIESILCSKIKHGIVSIPIGSLNYKSAHNIHFYEGAEHNLPDVSAETTAKKIRSLVSELGSDDLLLVLISGGGSSLLPLPKAPVTLDQKTTLIKSLANSGADIKELNIVRKRLSDLKGGQLSMKAQPAQVVSLILSDIVGDPLDLIASGPTTENEDDPSKAISILEKHNLLEGLPESIKTVLYQSDNYPNFPRDNVRNYIIGSNKISIAAALEEASCLNYVALGLSNTITGNINDVASQYARITQLFCSFLEQRLSLKDLAIQLKSCCVPMLNLSQNVDMATNKDLCLVLGGEITVEVRGKGKGGRNQQLALQFSNILDTVRKEIDHFDIYFLSAGTDGIDGPTDAAGAIGYLHLVSEAKKENLDVQEYLDECDSYNFYKKFRNGYYHVITGHTNTNVMDIHIIIIKKKMKSVLSSL